MIRPMSRFLREIFLFFTGESRVRVRGRISQPRLLHGMARAIFVVSVMTRSTFCIVEKGNFIRTGTTSSELTRIFCGGSVPVLHVCLKARRVMNRRTTVRILTVSQHGNATNNCKWLYTGLLSRSSIAKALIG